MVLRQRDDVALGKVYITVGQDDTCDYIGTTDVCIQEAINKANSLSGGCVLIKAGTYNISSQITLYSNISLIGSGWATILYATNASNIAVLYADTKSNIIIKDLYINGNKANQTDNVDTHGLWLKTCTDCIVQNCYFYRCRHHGASATNTSVRCKFINCISDGNRQDGIVLGNSTYCSILDCISINHELYNGFGVYSSDGSSNNCLVDNCIAYDNTGSGFNVEGGDNTCISNCIAYGNSEGSNVYVSDGGAFNSDNLCYSNCNFSNNTSFGMSIHCHNVKLTGCEITANGDAGIQLPAVKDPLYLTITGCNISDNASHGIQATTATYLSINNCQINGNGPATANRFGIYIASGVTRYSITNNHIMFNSESGIKAIGSNGIISGNTILDNSKVTANAAGIDIPAGTTYLSIIGNQIYDTAGAGGTQKYGIAIGADTTNYLIIFLNMLKGNVTGAIYQAGSAGAQTIKDHNIES